MNRQQRGYPENPKTLADFMRKKRIDLGLSQAQLAKALGVWTRTVEVWEMNRMQPTSPYRARIIKFLGFNPGVCQ